MYKASDWAALHQSHGTEVLAELMLLETNACTEK